MEGRERERREADVLRRAVRRNTLLLAASLAVSSTLLQLVAALSSLTFVDVSGVEGLLGLGPALFLTSAALAAFPAGRAMDRFGRVPVLATGFASGATGAAVTALGAATSSTPVVVLGFVLLGAAGATAALTRTAGGDMYPPERRGRGIALVLSGAVFGSILGPAVFGPLFAGRDVAGRDLVAPWLVGAGLMVVGLLIVLAVRPDPRRIAELLAGDAGGRSEPPRAPLGETLRRPGVVPAVLAAVASFSVMVAVMNLTGYVVVDHHDHAQSSVFPIIGAHVLGMYALILVVGIVVDRIGRREALVGGLALMAVSVAPVVWLESVPATMVLLFGLGLGWNLSWVAAASELVDRTGPSERGRLVGFTDLVAGLTGAALALAGGYALDALGVAALAFGAAALVTAPALWILRLRPATPGPASAAARGR